MIIYLLLASFLFFGAYSKRKDMTYYIGLVSLFAISAFRDFTLGGTDAYIYRGFFTSGVPKLTELKGFESDYSSGYVFLNSLIRQFTDNYYVYQVIYCLITIFLIHLVLTELELNFHYRCIFLFSYFCFRYIWNSWVVLRQNYANLIFWILLICIYKCEKNQKGKRLILVIAALFIPSLFHSSALVNIVFLPLLFVLGKIDSKVKLWLIPTLSAGLYFVGDTIYRFSLGFAVEYLDDRYSMHMTDTYNGGNSINSLLRLVFFLLFAFYYNKIQYKHKQFVLDTLSLMLLIGSIDAELMTRVYEYFAIGLYCTMTLFSQFFAENSKKVAAALFYFAMMIILFRFVLITDAGLYADYRMFFYN